VAIEALACGTPVIARRVGALPEIIRDGVDGFFGETVDEMIEALDRVATLDRGALRERVRDRFSGRRMTDDYEAVYARVLAEANGYR
jgi:glycosyltransferase involved in cell wall biosynthesis